MRRRRGEPAAKGGVMRRRRGEPAAKGGEMRLSDIVLAVQTEIPLLKQHLSDQLWTIRGKGLQARRYNRLSGAVEPLTVRPSRARTLDHGFATVVRFFPGAREPLAAIDDEVAHALVQPEPGRAACFEDQYASTGGELYELLAGHDSCVADLRPLVKPGRCGCHSYDWCSM